MPSFEPGDLITNGMSAGTVIAHVGRDPFYKAPGYEIWNVSLEAFGGNVGLKGFVPDYLASSWRKIEPGEWTPVLGSTNLHERYVWVKHGLRLTRELRKVEA
jgi:hypothetical protein